MSDQTRDHILEALPGEVKLLLDLEVLKDIERRNPLGRSERRERVGEHCWHLALSVILLAEFSAEPIDVPKAVLLAVVHDAAEAFVGDTFAFGPDVFEQWSREHGAMEALGGSSKSAATRRLVELWNEYEALETPEARFVKGMDAFLPIILNFANVANSSWVEHDVHSDQVRKRLDVVRDWIGSLAEINDCMIDRAQADGHLG